MSNCLTFHLLLTLGVFLQFDLSKGKGQWSEWTRTNTGLCLSSCKQIVTLERICTNSGPPIPGLQCIGDDNKYIWGRCRGGRCSARALPVKSYDTDDFMEYALYAVAGAVAILLALCILLYVRLNKKKKEMLRDPHEESNQPYATFDYQKSEISNMSQVDNIAFQKDPDNEATTHHAHHKHHTEHAHRVRHKDEAQHKPKEAENKEEIKITIETHHGEQEHHKHHVHKSESETPT